MEVIYILSSHNLSILEVFKMSVYALPMLFYHALPFAAFLGVAIVFSASQKDIIILRSIGLKNASLARPYLLFFAFLTIIQMAFSYNIVSVAVRKFIEHENKIGQSFFYSLLKEKEIATFGDTTAYLERFDESTKEFENLIYNLSANSSQSKSLFLSAQQGKFDLTKLYIKGDFYRVKIEQKTQGLAFVGQFEEVSILHNLSSFFESFNKKSYTSNPEVLSLDKLLLEILKSNDKTHTKNDFIYYLSNFTTRITWPFYTFLLPSITLLIWMSQPFSRHSNLGFVKVGAGFLSLSLLGLLLPTKLAGFVSSLQILCIIHFVIICLIFGFFILKLRSNY